MKLLFIILFVFLSAENHLSAETHSVLFLNNKVRGVKPNSIVKYDRASSNWNIFALFSPGIRGADMDVKSVSDDGFVLFAQPNKNSLFLTKIGSEKVSEISLHMAVDVIAGNLIHSEKQLLFVFYNERVADAVFLLDCNAKTIEKIYTIDGRLSKPVWCGMNNLVFYAQENKRKKLNTEFKLVKLSRKNNQWISSDISPYSSFTRRGGGFLPPDYLAALYNKYVFFFARYNSCQSGLLNAVSIDGKNRTHIGNYSSVSPWMNGHDFLVSDIQKQALLVKSFHDGKKEKTLLSGERFFYPALSPCKQFLAVSDKIGDIWILHIDNLTEKVKVFETKTGVPFSDFKWLVVEE